MDQAVLSGLGVIQESSLRRGELSRGFLSHLLRLFNRRPHSVLARSIFLRLLTEPRAALHLIQESGDHEAS